MWRFCNTVNNFSMDKKCAQVWQRLSAALKPQISADSFKRWFSAIELVEAKVEIDHAYCSKQHLPALDRK